MIKFKPLGVALFAMSFMMPSASVQAGPAVVELFTSQGCSSCPPADKLLGEITELDNVVALTLPVDYWDYLGWTDSFGSPEHSNRQKFYALSRGDRSVYTPQIVVDGKAHHVGSDRGQISRALRNAGTHDIEVQLAVSGNNVEIALPESKKYKGPVAAVWLMTFSKSEPVSIGRGENAGRKVVYHNVVRKMVRVGDWDGNSQSIKISRDLITQSGASGCAVVVQQNLQGGVGPILGAAIVNES